jgi:hypothetical protein
VSTPYDWNEQRGRGIERDVCPICRRRVTQGVEFDPDRLNAVCDNERCPVRFLVRDAPADPWRADESVTPWRYRPWDAPDTWAADNLGASPLPVRVQLNQGEILEGTLAEIVGSELHVIDREGMRREVASSDVTAYALSEPPKRSRR